MEKMQGRFNNVGKYATFNDGMGSKVQKHKKKDCDINNIISKYRKTGVLGDPVHTKTPIFCDCRLKGNYHEMQNIVKNADRAFMSLPPALRAKFENDPARAFDFVSKPENTEEAVKLGLLPKSALSKKVGDPNDSTKSVDKQGEKVPAQESDSQLKGEKSEASEQ